jgi:hypothetical protein
LAIRAQPRKINAATAHQLRHVEFIEELPLVQIVLIGRAGVINRRHAP